MMFSFRLTGLLAELLKKEKNRTRTIRRALIAYYRERGYGA